MTRITIASLKAELQSVRHNNAVHIDCLITDHDKAMKAKDSTISYQQNRTREVEAELDQMHCLLDALPGALPRKSVPAGEAEWCARNNTAMTRLASWLAFR